MRRFDFLVDIVGLADSTSQDDERCEYTNVFPLYRNCAHTALTIFLSRLNNYLYLPQLFLVRDGSASEASLKSDAPQSAPRGLPQLPGDDENGGGESETPANRARRLSVEGLLGDASAGGAASGGALGGNNSNGSGGWTSVRAVLTTDRVPHLFDSSLPDETNSKDSISSSSSVSGAAAAAALGAALLGGSKTSSSEAAARGVVGAQVVRSINCRRASFAVEAIVPQPAAGAGSDRTSSSTVTSAAALCFEITVASGSLLKKFNNMFSGDGLDHFVFQATTQRQLEVGCRAFVMP